MVGMTWAVNVHPSVCLRMKWFRPTGPTSDFYMDNMNLLTFLSSLSFPCSFSSRVWTNWMMMTQGRKTGGRKRSWFRPTRFRMSPWQLTPPRATYWWDITHRIHLSRCPGAAWQRLCCSLELGRDSELRGVFLSVSSSQLKAKRNLLKGCWSYLFEEFELWGFQTLRCHFPILPGVCIQTHGGVKTPGSFQMEVTGNSPCSVDSDKLLFNSSQLSSRMNSRLWSSHISPGSSLVLQTMMLLLWIQSLCIMKWVNTCLISL